MKGFPRGMGFSGLDERRRFYESEFDVRAVASWIGGRRCMRFAMIPGRHTGIVTPAHAQDKDNVVMIHDWRSASDLKEYALDYLPEGLYYDRNRYREVSKCAECRKGARACRTCGNYYGQQLAFDLDPENVDCPYHGHIGDKIQAGRGLSLCMYEFKAVRRQAIDLSRLMKEKYELVSVVYSGRGFHVVVDDEAAYRLTKNARARIAREIGRRFSIDEWVTEGGSRLLRLPWSLNGIVSRKCIIIKREKDLVKFDPRTSRTVLPGF